MHDNFIRERKPGEFILPNKTDVTIICKRGYTGDNCDKCAERWAGKNCDTCVTGWAGDNCDFCDHGWTGENCDSCDGNFGPPGQCDSCLRGWAGNSCAICANGWTGLECDACSRNFGPPGQCDRCLTGWTGDNCYYCEGFGFSTESNCTECIQNGYWKGMIGSTYLDVHLTFTGDTCSDLVLGKFIYTLYQTQFSYFPFFF